MLVAVIIFVDVFTFSYRIRDAVTSIFHKSTMHVFEPHYLTMVFPRSVNVADLI